MNIVGSRSIQNPAWNLIYTWVCLLKLDIAHNIIFCHSLLGVARPSLVKWPLFVYPGSSWCIHYVNMIYDQPDRAAHTIFSLILFLHNHQTNSHSLSTLSCFCFKISSLSVNTKMLFHLCLNQTSNGGDILQSITVCVFWSRVIPGLKGWWWRARYSVTPQCWSEYQVSTCQQPA